jgi:hypothetical protein
MDAIKSVSASFTPSGTSYTLALAPGFNLIGNALNTTLNVASIFGNQTNPVAGITPNIISVWKWIAASGRWAFYSPQLTVDGNAFYALSHNFDLLSAVNPGEGYWVFAVNPLTLPAQSGTNFNWNGFNFANLFSGFNLIATAGNLTPSQFNNNVSVTPPTPGVIATNNLISLWAWDAVAVNWYFYAPLLESSGGLAAVKTYADSHNFLHFQDFSKQLGIGTGFWVNKP